MDSDSLRIDLSDLPSPPGRHPSSQGEGDPGTRPGVRFLSKAFRWALLLGLLTVLPFFTLLRVSVFLFLRYDAGSWRALGGGVAATVLLLILYLVGASFRVGRKGRVPRSAVRGIGVLVGAYCLFTLLYLSPGNAKTPEIRATYTSLHPLLRVAVSTVLLVDRDGVLTATGRRLEEYGTWGIEPNERSLHVPQPDGFVHAVDLRTLGRPEWQNVALALYFRMAGLGTLRHTGTADHLHVALPPH